MGDDELYDPHCGGCEMAQADYKELEKVVENLAVLICRLARNIEKTRPNNELCSHAMAYLMKNNLLRSPLRENDEQVD